jgi:DNA-binding transcriptional ArsR family regulator
VVHAAAAFSEDVNDLDKTLVALADTTRRSTVDLLRRRPRRAGELAAALTISPAAMSRHLRVLRRSGLVVEEALEEDARVRIYRLKPESFAGLRHWLEGVEASWAGELQAFKAHAERAGAKRPK